MFSEYLKVANLCAKSSKMLNMTILWLDLLHISISAKMYQADIALVQK